MKRQYHNELHYDTEIIKGAQVMYEYATFRRASVWGEPAETKPQDQSPPKPQSAVISEPQTPAISNFEIDDEFNLPVSLALTMLVAYMLIGAAVFMVWEKWDFFPAFYFVFMSMSTIGFGDIVPEQPTFMIISIVYLCFGLALMTMCINVVQDKLSDTFNQASAKIGETIGIDVDNNDDKETSEEKESDDKSDNREENEVTDLGDGGDTDDGHKLLHNIEESPFSWSTAQLVR